MDKEIVIITEPQRLVEFADENDMLFHLTESEASLLLKYMHSTNYETYRVLGEREGQLFMKKGTVYEDKLSGKQFFSEADWEKVILDEVVDEICEMNYELKAEILERLEERGMDFKDRSVYESLVKDSKRLDAMFSRTEFSKKLNEMAENMAEAAIHSYLESKGASDKDELEQKQEEGSLRQDVAKEEETQKTVREEATQLYEPLFGGGR